MGTPLEVLSLAASMLESKGIDDCFRKSVKPNRTMLFGNTDKMSDGVQKDLPTRVERRRRSRSRQEVADQLQFDDEHRMKVQNCKTTYTQTPAQAVQLSSQYSEVVRHLSHNVPVTSASSPTQPSETPLNLTMDGSIPPPHRHNDVISSAAVPASVLDEHSFSHSHHSGQNGQEKVSGICDSSIEEHFRRSLGKKYNDEFTTTSKKKISVSEDSVDDHFSRSLGKTWDDIKAKNETLNSEMQSDSVDDHFSKALGENWSRIKQTQSNRTEEGSYNIKCQPDSSSFIT